MNFSSRVKLYVARVANLLILALFMCVAVEVKAQWTTPDGNGNTTTTGSGNVGVSNPTPRYKLDILGSANNAQIRFGMDSSDSGGFLFSIQPAHATFAAGASWSNFGWTARALNASSVTADNGYLHFYTNGGLSPGTAFTPTARMSINPFGSVGIGTTNPGSKLHVVSGTDTNTSMLSLDTGVHGGTQMWVYGTANNESGMELNVYRAGAYTPRFGVSYSGTVFLQPAGGNVGVGTSTPDAFAKLHLYGSGGFGQDIQTTTNDWTRLRLITPTRSWGFFLDGQSTGLIPQGSLGLYDYTASAFRMVFNTNGNVGIGLPSAGFKLDVSGSINGSGLCIAGVCKTDWSQVGGGTSQWLNGASSSINYGSGNVGIGTATPTQKLEVSGAALINTIYGSSASSGVLSLQSTSHATKGTIQIGVDQTTTTSIGQSGTAGNKLLVATDRLIVNNAGVRVNGAADHGDLSVTKINITNTDALQFRTTTPNIQSNGSLLFTAQNVGGDNVRFNVQNSSISNAFVIDTNSATPARLFDVRDLGTSKFTVAGNGNVGIGVPGPGYKLDVAGSINSSGLCIAGICKSAWSEVGGQWANGASSSISYSAGNVGIGTTTPLHRLQIGTNTATSTATPDTISMGATYSSTAGANAKFRLWDNNAGNVYGIGVSQLQFDFIIPATARYVWNVAGVEKMRLDENGNVTIAGNINAKYQDVAEWVDSSQELAPGTVVVLDASKSNQVIAATQSYDSRVAGVISLRPGITLGEASEGRVLVATTGRVKVKVDATNGPIQIGDLLVTSDREGFAMKSAPVDLGGIKMHRPGTLIGKALESLDKGTGEILVLLSLQ
jgi:hypothetical protein